LPTLQLTTSHLQRLNSGKLLGTGCCEWLWSITTWTNGTLPNFAYYCKKIKKCLMNLFAILNCAFLIHFILFSFYKNYYKKLFFYKMFYYLYTINCFFSKKKHSIFLHIQDFLIKKFL